MDHTRKQGPKTGVGLIRDGPLLRSIIALLKWKGFDALDLAASLKDDDVQLPSFLPSYSFFSSVC